MSIPEINQLANMEYMLYGGRVGMNSNCPSVMNGYTGGYNNYTNYYNYMNPTFNGGYPNQNIFTLYNNGTNVSNQTKETCESNSNVDLSNPQFKGLSDDLNELGDYYIKNAAPSESLTGAAIGGVAFGMMNNPRTGVHFINSIRATFSDNLKKAFANVRVPGSRLNQLYTNTLVVDGEVFKGGHELVSEAYARMHKLEALKHSKIGAFRQSLKAKSQKELLKECETIEKNLSAALEAGNIKEIAEYTEQAKRLGNRFTGWIPKGLRAIKLQKPMTWLRKHINPTHYETNIAKVAEENIAKSATKATIGSSLAHSCGIGNGLFFAGFEFLNDMVFEHKIQDAFAKDKETGWKQVRQTALKGIGSAVGWAVGEGIGAWAGGVAAMKIGATLGTTIAPGIGTAIGAVAGLVGGSIGMWLMGKITKKINGEDAGTLAKVEKMKQTKEGQVQLLQLTAKQAEDDKKLSQRTKQAIQNVASFYGASSNA